MEKLEKTNGDASGREGNAKPLPFACACLNSSQTRRCGLGKSSSSAPPPTSAFCRAADAKAGRPRSTAAWFSCRGREVRLKRQLLKG